MIVTIVICLALVIWAPYDLSKASTKYVHAGIEVMCNYGQVVVSIRKLRAWYIAATSKNHCEAESDAKPN